MERSKIALVAVMVLVALASIYSFKDLERTSGSFVTPTFVNLYILLSVLAVVGISTYMFYRN